jgi:SAM-dependent methyltransferase
VTPTGPDRKLLDTSGQGGFEAAYVPYLARSEDRHFWFRARNEVIRALVSQIEAGMPSGYRVLEVGCGTGNTLRVLDALCRRGSVVGMDSQREGLSYALRRVSCALVQGDIAHAPFRREIRFNLIAMFDVLEHIPADVEALAAIRLRLATDGALIMTVPAAPELWSSFDLAARHCRRYTPEHLTRILTAAGFRVDYVSPFMAGLYPIAWVMRRWRKPAADREAICPNTVLDDLRIVPVFNGCLRWLLAREVPLIHARYRMPFGTSLIAIARRDCA